MEQHSHKRVSLSPHVLLSDNQCTSTAVKTAAESMLWPCSDEYLGFYSASSSDELPDALSAIEVKLNSRHQQGESSSDEVSPEPIDPTRSFKHYATKFFGSLDRRPSSDPVSSKNQRRTKSNIAASEKPAEESNLASTQHVQRNAATSLTSLENSVVTYFAAHKLEMPGFSHCATLISTVALSTSNPEKHGANPSYSAPEKRSFQILTSVPEEPSTRSTHSAPERKYSDPLKFETKLALQRRRFGPLWTMNDQTLIRLAMDVRSGLLVNHKVELSCQVTSRLNGSFNLVYILEFDDGLKYAVRLPVLGWGSQWTSTAEKAFESQVLTMYLIRRMTTIPIPEILAFDATQGNSLETPYMVMSFISGVTVEELWWDETGPTPLEERRSRILTTTAMAMAQLQSLKFERIGSLRLNDEPDNKTFGIGPCYGWNLPSRHAELQGQGPDIREFGPFRTTKEYLTHLHNSQERDSHPMAVGCRELLARMIASLPLSVEESLGVCQDETFVLTAPDFDSQNIMIDEGGNLTGIIDWDHVQTMPRCLGYCRCPEWITRDCDPVRYDYQSSAMEDSQEKLREYRKQYAGEMVRLLGGQGDARFAKNSHIVGAVWTAAARQYCQVSLMSKLLDRALARKQGLNKFDLMEDIGEGDWTISEAEILEGFQVLFEVQRIEWTEGASAEDGMNRGVMTAVPCARGQSATTNIR